MEQLFQALPTQAYLVRIDSDGDIEWVAQEQGAETVYRHEPHTGFWRRVAVGLFGLLPIEGQL